MTAREKLNRQMRWSGTAACLGFLLFMTGPLLGQIDTALAVSLCLSGFAMGGFGIIVQRSGLRCPFCRGNYRTTFISIDFWVSEQVRFCQRCGHSLDEELPPPAPPVHRDPHYWHR
jgi:hypothetical protein